MSKYHQMSMERIEEIQREASSELNKKDILEKLKDKLNDIEKKIIEEGEKLKNIREQIIEEEKNLKIKFIN